MLVLPNMGLVKWESLNDNFSHEQLAANWSLVDEHDHSPGKGKPIPFGGLAEQSVGANNLRSGVITEIASLVKFPVTKYEPKIIATEQTRESTTFATLATADEIKNVVVATNQIVILGHISLVKSSVSGAGRVAFFVGANQLKSAGGSSAASPAVQETSLSGTAFNTVASTSYGVQASPVESMVTTGQTIGVSSTGGMAYVFGLAAGTYTFTVQFKSTSGNITAKERKTWAYVLG